MLHTTCNQIAAAKKPSIKTYSVESCDSTTYEEEFDGIVKKGGSVTDDAVSNQQTAASVHGMGDSVDHKHTDMTTIC